MDFPLILLSFFTVVLVVWIVWPEKKTDLPGVLRVGMIVVLLVGTVAFVLGHTNPSALSLPTDEARASQKSRR